jgi:hypothetical protein
MNIHFFRYASLEFMLYISYNQCSIFKISQFNIYKQSNITYFSIIFNTLHNYNYQDERTQGEEISGRTGNGANGN